MAINKTFCMWPCPARRVRIHDDDEQFKNLYGSIHHFDHETGVRKFIVCISGTVCAAGWCGWDGANETHIWHLDMDPQPQQHLFSLVRRKTWYSIEPNSTLKYVLRPRSWVGHLRNWWELGEAPKWAYDRLTIRGLKMCTTIWRFDWT